MLTGLPLFQFSKFTEDGIFGLVFCSTVLIMILSNLDLVFSRFKLFVSIMRQCISSAFFVVGSNAGEEHRSAKSQYLL
jgi:hypothetical protein